MVLVVVVLSDLGSNVRLDAISSHDQIALQPFTALQLHFSSKFIVDFDDFVISENFGTRGFGRFQQDSL